MNSLPKKKKHCRHCKSMCVVQVQFHGQMVFGAYENTSERYRNNIALLHPLVSDVRFFLITI